MKLFSFLLIAFSLSALPQASFASDKPLKGLEIVAESDISVGLNGLVCDFCSIALNKTFRKRDEVQATYVDLDTKILSIVLTAGAMLSNDDIIHLVKQAGYTATRIVRKDGREYVPPTKS